MSERKLVTASSRADIASLTLELKELLDKEEDLASQIEEAGILYKKISNEINKIENFYACRDRGVTGIVKTFKIKPEASLDNYMGMFISDDAKAIEKDWSEVGRSLWFSVAKNYMKGQMAK